MRAQGVRWLGIGTVFAVLTVLWWWARLEGHIGGPDQRLAEYLSVPLPVIYLAFGLLKLGAAHNSELPSRVPQQLPIRLTTAANDPTSRLAVIFVWWSTVAWGTAFAFVVSLYPRNWSDSWTCSPCSDGTCCNLVDGGVVSTGLFVILSLVGSLYVLFGLASGVVAARRLIHRRKLPRPIVEVSAKEVRPGGRWEACAQLLGRGYCHFARLELVCEEVARHKVGSSTSTDTEIVFRQSLVERHNERLVGSPLILRAETQLPVDAMHSFEAKNNQIRWRLVLNVSASVNVEESFDIEVPAIP